MPRMRNGLQNVCKKAHSNAVLLPICVKKGTEFHRADLANLIWDMKNPFVFRMLEKQTGEFYFIVNEQLEINVFYYDKDDKVYKFIAMQEFIDNYWWRFSNEQNRKTIGCRNGDLKKTKKDKLFMPSG